MSGLPPLPYRTGDFAALRKAMLAQVAAPDLLAGLPNPFAAWRPGNDGDFHTLFIELWAYLGDVLTFYQERIANEAYVPTATQRDALVRLAQLVDYAAAPGAAAETLVAFTLDAKARLTIPAGTRVSARGAPPVVFETSTDLSASGALSAVPFSPVALVNQFARLSSFQTVFATAAQTSYDFVDVVVPAFWDVFGGFGGIAGIESIYARSWSYLIAIPVTTYADVATTVSTRNVILAGASLRLAPGDVVVAVEHDGTDAANPRWFRLTAVAADRARGTTTVSWEEPVSFDASGAPVELVYADSADDPVVLYALRVKAGCFGNAAPAWSTVSPTLTAGLPSGNPPVYPAAGSLMPDWDDGAAANLPQPGQDDDRVLLDGKYAGVRASQSQPDWAVLIAPTRNDETSAVYRVDAADEIGATGYTLAATVTRLRLTESVASGFPVRTTTVYTGAEKLTRHDLFPLPDPATGTTLVLSGALPELAAGQTVIVSGTAVDPDTGQPTAQPLAEVATIAGAPQVDAAHGLTVVTLDGGLTNAYLRATASLFGNVVPATHGETVPDEPLGVGDGSALQQYPLAKSPLTFVASAGAAGGAVASTLTVSVDGARWDEAPTLLDLGPNARAYELDRPPDGSAVVTFGDGADGARPATGAAVRARYRRGLGTSGNVAAGQIATAVDKAPGVKSVANPLAASGGVDPEGAESIRANAPEQVRTFERAIALDDLAALAQSYPGVAKARAAWRTRGDDLQAIARPYLALTIATSDGLPLAGHAPPLGPRLRAFLDARRDPNVPLRLVDAQLVPVEIAATLDIDPSAGRSATLALARTALGLDPAGGGFFDVALRPFGERIAIGTIYALLQDVPGVSGVVITTFRRVDGVAPVADAFALQPGELATLAPTSILSPGSGGYADR